MSTQESKGNVAPQPQMADENQFSTPRSIFDLDVQPSSLVASVSTLPEFGSSDGPAPTTLTPDDLRHHVTRLQSENSRLRTIISRLNYEPLYHTSTSRCSLLTTEDDHLQTQTTDVRATNSDFLAEISVLHQQVQNSDDRNDRRVFIELQNAKAQLQLIQGEKLAVECEVFDLQSKIAKLGKDGKKATQ